MLGSLNPSWTGVVIVLCTLVFTLLGIIVRMRPIMKKMEFERIHQLEQRFDALASHQAAERELHAAEMAMVRHRLNSESASLDALVAMLETNASIPPETIRRITDSRIAAAKAFAEEMASITEKRIQLAAALVPAPGPKPE